MIAAIGIMLILDFMICTPIEPKLLAMVMIEQFKERLIC